MVKPEITSKYEMTIGIECHVQLDTQSKLFSSAPNDAREAEPNSKVSQLCFGLPGTLPVLNERAVELAVKAGLSMNCKIEKFSKFDRKHYFYPDLPKGYQISQFDQPTVGEGRIELLVDGKQVQIGIERAHIEEDAGKLVHESGSTLVDLNRAGTPLIEIVSRPDMHSAAEAKAYARELYLTMKMSGVSQANLYYGNMRFDVNLSIAPVGASELGTRTETKNLNSFRSIERAVKYEFLRQVEVIESGGIINQETRGWDDDKQQTYSMRSKEDAKDYRYFPDPDLPAIELSDADIEKVESQMKHLPESLGGQIWSPSVFRRLLSDRGYDDKSIEAMIDRGGDNPEYLDIWVKALESNQKAADFAFKFFVNDLFAVEGDVTVPSQEQIMSVFDLIDSGDLSSSGAKKVLLEITPGQDAAQVAKDKGLLQMNDDDALSKIIDQVITDSPKVVQDFRSGNERAIGALIGAVMKQSKGQANPQTTRQMILDRLRI